MNNHLPHLINMCGKMSISVCHASPLKDDTIALRILSYSFRVCNHCDMYQEETVKHLVMQCPSHETEICDMYSEMKREMKDAYDCFKTEHSKVFPGLLNSLLMDFDFLEISFFLAYSSIWQS